VRCAPDAPGAFAARCSWRATTRVAARCGSPSQASRGASHERANLERARLVFLILALPRVDSADGLTLRVSPGPTVEAVTLDWTGGEPMFRIYRSVGPLDLLAPPNLLARRRTERGRTRAPSCRWAGSSTTGLRARVATGRSNRANTATTATSWEATAAHPSALRRSWLRRWCDQRTGRDLRPARRSRGRERNICREDCTVCGDGWPIRGVLRRRERQQSR